MKISTLIISIFLLTIQFATSQTTITLQPHYAEGSNTYVRNDFPSTPSIGAQDLTAYAWTAGGDPTVGRGFFKIGLEDIPAGAVINSATLYLYANTNTALGFGGSEPQTGTNQAHIYRVVEDWDYETVTWNTQPEITLDNSVLIEESTDPVQDYELNIVNMIQDMMDNPTESFGFTIRLDNEIDFYSSLLFVSSFHITDAMHPKLEITYTAQTGINDNEAINYYISPNPASDIVNVFFSKNLANDTNLELYDLTGKLLKEVTLNSSIANFQLNVSAFENGVYLLKIGGLYFSKFEIFN